MASRPGPGLAVRLTAAIVLAMVPLTAAAYWTVEQVTVHGLQSAVDADLLTQLREWRTFTAGRPLDTPAQVAATATAWLEQQRDHPSTQVQVIKVSGGPVVSNHPGVLAQEIAREAAEARLPPSARDRPLPGLLDVHADAPGALTTASTQDAGAVRVLSEPIVRAGRNLGTFLVADSLLPVTRARDRLRQTFWAVGGLTVAGAAALAAGTSTVLTRPLRQLTAVAAEVDAGRLEPRSGLVRGPSDLVAVGRSVDRMLDRLQQAFQRQREFAGEISHDLRTPLAIARAQAELLRDEDDAARRCEGVGVVLAQIDAVDRLVADLLILALAEERAPIRTHRIDVTDLLADLKAELSLLGDRRYVVSACGGSVAADPDQLARVLRNLASNAVRHTAPGGLISITATAQGDMLRISVADSGPGLAPEDLERVFERFHTSPRDRSAGAGLGLPIARAIVQAHGGRIWAESPPGSGARFELELPHYER